MPAVKSGTRPQGLTQDDLIARLAPDAGNPANTQLISGWLGRSTRPGHWRVYVTPELNRFLEFADSEVLHVRRLTTSDVPLGGTLIWVRGEASLLETCAPPRKGQASFLEGDLMSLLSDPKARQIFDLTMRLRPIATTAPCAVAASAKFCVAAGIMFGAAITYYVSVNLCD